MQDPSGVLRITGKFPALSVKDRGGFQSRHASTLALVREAFEQYAPDFEGLSFDFFICSFDNPESCNALAEVAPSVLAYSVTDACLPNVLAVPDFVFGGWPEAGIADYTQTCAMIAETAKTPPDVDKVFWIGNATMHESREQLVAIGQTHPDDMDFRGMQWRDTTTPEGRLAATDYVSLPDHTRYAMLLDIRGAGYSGRLKMLMHAARPVLLVERPFREFFYDALKPYEHYMPVRGDLSDLAERVQELKRNHELAARLGHNAAAFAAEHLTRDKALARWREVLLKIGQQASA